LVDNKGFARCSASNENLASAVADNYLSTLFLSLTYVYVVSDTVELKIERTGVVQDIGIQGPNECKDKLDGTACFNNLMVCRGQ
jgi:hypothetical protein